MIPWQEILTWLAFASVSLCAGFILVASRSDDDSDGML